MRRVARHGGAARSVDLNMNPCLDPLFENKNAKQTLVKLSLENPKCQKPMVKLSLENPKFQKTPGEIGF